ncbi:MAG: nucleotidyltransferase family protein [Burkholderiaceae bacterium]|nr:nucleotidyltransferase family protein [Burkholderiaceae bacterium]
MTPGAIGILLAAGAGSRFARASGGKDKLLAKAGSADDSATVLAMSARALRDGCERTIAVVRPGQAARRTVLETAGCEVVESKRADGGMGFSLADAVEAVLGRYHPRFLVILLGDLPSIRAGTVPSILAAAANRVPAGSTRVVVPVYRGLRGHPTVFFPCHFGALLACQGDRGAVGVVREFGACEIDVDDPGILHDIDLPDDLREMPPTSDSR